MPNALLSTCIFLLTPFGTTVMEKEMEWRCFVTIQKLHLQQMSECTECSNDIKFRLVHSILAFWKDLDRRKYNECVYSALRFIRSVSGTQHSVTEHEERIFEFVEEVLRSPEACETELFSTLIQAYEGRDRLIRPDRPLDAQEMETRKEHAAFVLSAYAGLYATWDPEYENTPEPESAENGGIIWPNDEKTTMDLEASDAKWEWYNQQVELRKDKETIQKVIAGYMGKLYSVPPKDVPSLEAVLDRFEIDAAWKALIMNSITE